MTVTQPSERPASATIEARQRVRALILAEADPAVVLDRPAVARILHAEAPLLGPADFARVLDDVMADVHGLGPLESLLADPGVSEVMVNGPGPVWVERQGRLVRTPVHVDTSTIEHLIEKIVAPLGLRADRSSPMVDARLPDGSRVNAVVPPLALDGPCITIRRFGARALPLAAFASADIVALLRWAVRGRLNIVVCGGTGSGKTTLLNALAAEIPAGERIVTIEDAAELRLPQDHVVRLEARPANAEGAGAVAVRSLVRNALRMRPDRIIVGECRGPEAFDMVQAMNTGHEGSLSTCHANGPDDALRRLDAMMLLAGLDLPLDAVRDHVDAAVDLIVDVTRVAGGARRINAVAEVLHGETRSAAARCRLLADAGAMVAAPTIEARAERGVAR